MIEGIYSRAFPISQVQIKASTCAATCVYKSGKLQTQLVNEFHRYKGSRQGSHVTALSKPLHTPQLLPERGPVGAVSLLLWVCLSVVKLPRLPIWIATGMNKLKAVPENSIQPALCSAACWERITWAFLGPRDACGPETRQTPEHQEFHLLVTLSCLTALL